MKLTNTQENALSYRESPLGTHHSPLVSPQNPLRVLASYYYFQKVSLDQVLRRLPLPQTIDFFLDCGAFSSMTRGVPLSLNKYAKYVLKYQSLLSVYVNLDVIYDPKATWENQMRLEQDYGLSPVPVFHIREPWSYLERNVERYPYIALGGVARSRAEDHFPWLVQCFQRAQGKSVFHGFGVSNWKVLSSFPWYSVDTSTWGQAFRFGYVQLFDAQKGVYVGVDLRKPQQCYQAASLFRRLGFDPADFVSPLRWDRKKLCALSILSTLEAERWLADRWGPVKIPLSSQDKLLSPDPPEAGLKLYLVEVQKDLSDVTSVLPYLLQKG